MSSSELRLADYLGHIAEAIQRIERYVQGMDEPAFLKNSLIQDAVVRNFEVIGEASHNIEKTSPKFVADHPELPLAFAYQMRNAVAHGYFKVDFAIVWNTISRDLPGLREKIDKALKSLPRDIHPAAPEPKP